MLICSDLEVCEYIFMNNVVEQLTLDEKLNEVITLELWVAFIAICMFGGLI